MPQGRIQPRTWFVEFGLAVSAASVMDSSEHEFPNDVPPTDAEIKRCLMDVMDKSNRDGRRIRCLQLVSFVYESRDPMAAVDIMQNPTDNQASTVDVVGFAHGTESILDTSHHTTMHSRIQDPRVINQRWTPVSIK